MDAIECGSEANIREDYGWKVPHIDMKGDL